MFIAIFILSLIGLISNFLDGRISIGHAIVATLTGGMISIILGIVFCVITILLVFLALLSEL